MAKESLFTSSSNLHVLDIFTDSTYRHTFPDDQYVEFSKHSQDRDIGTKGDIAHVSTSKSYGCKAVRRIHFFTECLLAALGAVRPCVTYRKSFENSK